MADTHNTQMRLSTDSDPMLSIPHDELRIAYSLLRELHRQCVAAYNAASKRWLHEHGQFEACVERAEMAERGLAEVQKMRHLEINERAASEEANATLRAQAATDAATIAELQASLAVMTNDRDHLMKSAPTATPPAAPDGAPALRPFDADISVDNCTVTMRVTSMPEEVRGKHDILNSHICAVGGFKLGSLNAPALMESVVWLRGGDTKHDNATVSILRFNNAEATAYAEKVRRLLDAANAQWAERKEGGQP